MLLRNSWRGGSRIKQSWEEEDEPIEETPTLGCFGIINAQTTEKRGKHSTTKSEENFDFPDVTLTKTRPLLVFNAPAFPANPAHEPGRICNCR